MSRLPRRFGRYVLLEQLGHGGMGTVYLARPIDRELGIPTPVVLKVLHTDLTNDEMFVRRFKHEAEIATRIDSPHVVKVYDAGRVGDALYFAMEQIVGFNVGDMLVENLRDQKPTPLSFVHILAQGALAGLDALHSARDAKGTPLGFVHRDLSPKNIMVGPNMNIYLIDLGIGKSAAQDWKTKTGVVLGTVGYMSPEQVMGKSVDLRSDLYAFGIVLFELLTSTRYIERGPVAKALRASVAPKFRAPSSLRAGVPEAIDKVVERALAHDPELRFQSAREMAGALGLAWPAPRREDHAELELVRARIEESLAQVEAKTELRSLLEEQVVEADEDVAPQAEIFATRAGVLSPMVAPARPSIIPPTMVSAMSSSMSNSAAISPMASASFADSRPRGTPSWVFGAAAFLGVAVCALLAVKLFAPSSELVPALEVPAAEPAQPAVSALPRVQQQIAPEPKVEEPVVETVRRERPDRVAKPKKEEPEKREVVLKREVVESAAPPIESTVDRLIARAQALRKRVDENAPKRGAIDALLAELLQLRASLKLASEKSEVDRVARELEKLERSIP